MTVSTAPLAALDVASRIGRLRAHLADASLDALLVTKLANVRFTLMTRVSRSVAPAADHNARRFSTREASSLGACGGAMFMARSSTKIGSSGNPPPNMSHA